MQSDIKMRLTILYLHSLEPNSNHARAHRVGFYYRLPPVERMEWFPAVLNFICKATREAQNDNYNQSPQR